MTIKEKIEELIDSNSQYVDKKEMIKFLLSLLGDIKYEVCPNNTPVTLPYYPNNTPVTLPYYPYCTTSINGEDMKTDMKTDTVTQSYFDSCNKEFNNIPGNAIIQ